MPYRTPKAVQEKKDAKRHHILDAAAKVFAKRGYYNTKVRDILVEAGISTGSFYFYFNNKEEVFQILYDEMINAYVSVLQEAVATMTDNAEHIAQSLIKAITLSLQAFQKNMELARIMLIGSVGINPQFEKKRTADYQKISLVFEEIFRELLQKRAIRVPDPKVAAILFTGSIFSLITNWLQEDNPRELVAYTQPLIVYNLQALGIQCDNLDLEYI
ncbi:MAG TPA: TetR/AcrR family transcriptional regulator [Bacillota bacterium]|nr:TetR/AcrR family transcriptional regulator [Bacillota bacterium]